MTLRLQQELEQKTSEVMSLEVQLSTIEETTKSDRERTLEEHKKQVDCTFYADFQKTRNTERESSTYNIQQLENKLRTLEEFKEQKATIEQQIQELRTENDELNRKMNHQQSTIEQQYRKNEEKLKQRHREEIEQIESEALARAKNLLSKTEQDVHRQNLKLVSDMNMQRGEVEDLKRQKQKALEENKHLKRELELNQAQMEECATKQSEQGKVIKMLKERNRALEGTIEAEASSINREKGNMANEFNSILNQKDSEISNLQHQIKIRSKELKNIKSLAQMILCLLYTSPSPRDS